MVSIRQGREKLQELRATEAEYRTVGILTDEVSTEKALEGLISMIEEEDEKRAVYEAMESEVSAGEVLENQKKFRMSLATKELEKRLERLWGPVFYGDDKLEMPTLNGEVDRVNKLVSGFKINLQKVILNQAPVVEAGDELDYDVSKGGRTSAIVWVDLASRSENHVVINMKEFRNRVFNDGSYKDADGNVHEYNNRVHRPTGDGIHNSLRVLNSKAFDLFKTHVEGSTLYARLCTDEEGVEHEIARQGRLTGEDLADISRLVSERFPWMHGFLKRPEK